MGKSILSAYGIKENTVPGTVPRIDYRIRRQKQRAPDKFKCNGNKVIL